MVIEGFSTDGIKLRFSRKKKKFSPEKILMPFQSKKNILGLKEKFVWIGLIPRDKGIGLLALF